MGWKMKMSLKSFITGFPLKLVNHTDLLRFSLTGGQWRGEEALATPRIVPLASLCWMQSSLYWSLIYHNLLNLGFCRAVLCFLTSQDCSYQHTWHSAEAHNVIGMSSFITRQHFCIPWLDCIRWRGTAFLIWKKLRCGKDEIGGCSGILYRTSSVRWQMADNQEEKWSVIFISAATNCVENSERGRRNVHNRSSDKRTRKENTSFLQTFSD